MLSERVKRDHPVLFFLLGLAAVLLGSNLKIPDPVVKFLSLYLMLSIGFKGGMGLGQVLDTTGARLAIA